MADRYPGYWQASDGHWYPDALMPPPPPDAQPVFVGPPPDDRPSSKGRGGLLVGAAFGAVLIGALAVGATANGGTEVKIRPTGLPRAIVTTDVPVVSVPETTVAPASIPETTAPPPTDAPSTSPPPPTTAAPTLPPTTSPPTTSPPTAPRPTTPRPTAPPPTAPPATFAPVPLVAGGGGCDPNYTPCVPIASDVDCAGGSGNGPAYVTGPITVIGGDPYGLDRDGDGVGCED
ncbi:MAG: hypothetical protein V9G12_13410 [Microthrixaceae bacterium]